jgi:hypothetical protein
MAEALMLALGEPQYEPFRYQPLLRNLPTSSPFEARRSAASCQAQDDADDAAGDPSFFIRDAAQMRALGSPSAQERIRWGSLNRRRAW